VQAKPYIVGFLSGSFESRLKDFCDEELPDAPDLLRELLLDLGRMLDEEWVRFATKEILRLDLPNQHLQLSQDVPKVPGAATLFPRELANVTNRVLLALLQSFGVAGSTSAGTGAKLWSELVQRMRYILVLFRSHQLYQSLLNEPFSAGQRALIKAGKMPSPPPPL
jgi:hypothetical protein